LEEALFQFDDNGVIYTCFQLGKVLRLKKILKNKSQRAPSCIVFSSHEQLLWGHIPELVESVKQDCLAQAYAVHVMSQHLGANHVDGGVWFRFSSFMSCYCDFDW
jgi:inositol-pentakisphosphate 2-kinase